MLRLLSEKDRKIIEEYIKRYPFETTFIQGNIANFSIENKKDIRRCGDYYGYFKNGRLVGIIPFYNLGSSTPHYEDEECIEAFSELILKYNVEFLLGMKKVILPLYTKIKDAKKIKFCDEDSFQINEELKPYENSKVKIIDFYEIPLEEAAAFAVEASKKGFDMKVSIEEKIKTFKERSKEEDYIFAVYDDEIIGQAYIQVSTDLVNQIGGVYTKEEYRNNGVCKAMVSELCKRIIKRGKKPVLMVKKYNTPALRAYEKLGFIHYDDYMMVRFEL
ncbi:hypothetical protein AN618_22910 [Fervidicola ferrireducens]|uniref:N-acetyltransferase domain-containing protein n=1 Tax=Fervidicola ferrireducens TaxID=520764 RepID=A0A140L1S2_9FIRM|nr:GNAT family N-acetyltransferase [Fervidicola ferrireducens]KXG74497.1 hypothetical protein AN618_22910 [Fervidicola ferrireducens]